MTDLSGRFFLVNDNVVAKDLGQETVIMDLVSGTYFGLNNVGVHIWRHIEAGATITDICKRLIVTYEVDELVAQSDIEALIRILLEKKLIRVG